MKRHAVVTRLQGNETMNNLYIVVSEELSYVEPVLDYNQGPLESYRIIEMVVARNHSQARIVAAKHGDNDYDGNVLNLPRMCVRQLAKRLPYPRGTIVTTWKCFDHWWKHLKVSAVFDPTPS
jgi:hypothetical protein